MLQKMNLPALATNLLALIVYLASPIVRLAVLPVSGIQCIRTFGFLFVVPMLLMIIVMLLSLCPINQISSITSFVNVIYLIIMLVFMPDAVTNQIGKLIGMGGLNMGNLTNAIGLSGSLLSTGSTYVVTAAWGYYLTLVLCILGSVGGLLLSLLDNAPKKTRPATTGRTTKMDGLYR